MGAIADLFKVLFDPVPVFERVREKPRFLGPFVALVVITLLVAMIMKPFYVAGAQTMIDQMPPDQVSRAPSAGTMTTIIIVSLPITLIVMLLVGTLLLWIGCAMAGAESKFGTLLSVLTYAFATFVVFSLVSGAVLFTRGADTIRSMADLRAPLGLDLLAPNTGRVLGTFLNGINPFSIWGVWLTGTGVAITHRISKGTGYGVAAMAYVIGLLLFSLMSSFGQGPG